jgi:translation initiation factor 1
MARKRNIVYSSDEGRYCNKCGRPEDLCQCQAQKQAKVQGDGTVRVSRETKGRKGAGVSVITGLPLNEKELKALAKVLKKKVGSGGTIRDGVIEIQGEHRDRLVEELIKLGYAAKRSGG